MLLCVVSGLVDRIARKAPVGSDDTVDAGARRKRGPTPYHAASAHTPGLLCVHPSSAVFSRDGAQVRERVLSDHMRVLVCGCERVCCGVCPECVWMR